MAKDESRRNKDGYFRSTFYYKGKQYAATSKISQKDADRKATLKEDKMERGEVGISGKMTVERWAKEWLETYRKTTTTDKVYRDYEQMLTTYVYPEFGKLHLQDVKDIHLQKALNLLEKKSQSYVSKICILLKAMFKQARISRLIVYDPAESLQLPDVKKGKRRSITDFERTHILKVSENHHAGLFVKTMLYCGLRPGEARALTWANVDLENGYIYVRLAFEGGKQELKPPKTDAGVRDIPIPKAFLPDLEKARSINRGYVFTQETTGNPHTESSLNKMWISFKKAVDISMGAKYGKVKAKDGKMRSKLILSVIDKELTLYCLRHTYCTDLEIAEVPINIARYLMGHSDISVTSKIYTHTSTAAIENARKKIDSEEDNSNNDSKEKIDREICG